MLERQPRPTPPWSRAFEVFNPPEGPAPDPTHQIELAQISATEFRLGSKINYTGDRTGLEGAVPPATIDDIRTVTPDQLPVTDLASVPEPFRWFVTSYGPHTPAALIHDRLIGISVPPEGLTDARADRYFRFMLEASGAGLLLRWIMWTAVAFRTRWASGTRKRLGLILWVALAGLGMTSAFLAVALPSWIWAAVAAGLPFLAASLWGKQYVAGLVAVLAGPFVLPPSLFAWAVFQLYRTAEVLTTPRRDEHLAEEFVARM